MPKNEARTAWIIAGILGVLLLIALYFWMTAKQDLATVLEQGREDITDVRDRIAADCTGNMQSAACKADLSELKSVLTEFSRDIENATTTGSTTKAN